MNLQRTWDRLDTFEQAYLIFVGIYALFWLVERAIFSPSTSSTTSTQPEWGEYLGEPALERLERGETIHVDRWHGNTLILSGESIIDVQSLKDVDEDENE